MRQTGDPDMTQKILTMGHGGGSEGLSRLRA
ncbi:MAG: hypothetical protein QG552_3057 [Thermodesulfobacteriota bacterium]|nr:hypothetical protein [Thermodesulfobacteriota bacterium]